MTKRKEKVFGFIEFRDTVGDLKGVFGTHASTDLDSLVLSTQRHVEVFLAEQPGIEFQRAVWCLIKLKPTDKSYVLTGDPLYEALFEEDKSFNNEILAHYGVINQQVVSKHKCWLEHIFTIENIADEEE